MTWKPFITTLLKLIQLYESLYTIAKNKSEVIKNGDLDALNQIMKSEQTHITAITALENERLNWTKNLAGYETATLLDCIQLASGSEKEKLTEIHEELSELLQKLKAQNELNQQLIHQSLQFVNFSLNMLLPQPDNVTYGPQQKKNQSTSYNHTSVFNSRV
ncbi:flagellar protein FlgN [Bacillus kwashiorkori]|uniref:flagellar protein FlgN n=1 Tax=Bacillus kwashiorkori TaxID=1522318 RepID=UPI0007835F7F|nr:flagellar protein FlgN [Bacillus kwashiorkori]